MRILVVEDEFYTRKAIVKMINEWDVISIIIDEVETGTDAIDYMNQNVPDIVITDICMPEMDGIKLSEYIHNRYPQVVIIVISGHANFEYAQKAIHLNVMEYLLKPIKKKQLLKLLDKIYDRLAKQKEQEKRQTQEKEAAQKDKIINKLMHAIYDYPVEYRELTKLLFPAKPPENIIVSVFQSHFDLDSIRKEQVKRLFDQRFQHDYIGFFNNVIKNEWIGVHFIYNQKRNLEDHFSILRRVTGNLHECLGGMFSIGVSSLHTQVSQIRKAYKQAKYMLNYRLLNEEQFLFNYCEKIDEGKDVLDFTFDNEIMLHQMIVLDKINEAKQMLKKVFEKAYSNRRISISNIQQVYLKILTIINRAADQLKFNKEEESIFYYLKKEVSEFCSLDSLIEYLCNYIDIIHGYTSDEDTKMSDSVIKDMENYIQEYYYCDISLEDLAKKRYFMNPNYLSRLFKAEKKQSFSSFLLMTRMSKAKQLLANKDLSIAIIANLVGYNNTSHFIRLFKKYYGRTPGSYKAE